MYCGQCGRLVPDRKKFCTGCGQAINANGAIPQFSMASEPVKRASERLPLLFVIFVIIVIITVVSVVILVVILNAGRKPAGGGAGTSAKQAEAQESQRLRELLGDEVPCNVITVGHDTGIEGQYNASIQEIHTYINRKTGTLTIVFNFDFANRYQFPFMRFLVRMFDQNGQYLTHFTTEERYAIEDKRIMALRSAGAKATKLLNKNNVLQYPVNMRDCSFVASVEFGIAFGS